MNDPHDGSELPDLSDDDVRLLYSICQRAGGSSDPPFKALFAAYDAILREEEIQQEHDGIIFRALLRVGESTAEANKQRRPVDLVARLENVLEARGITLVREDGQEELSGKLSRTERRQRLGRRVSFDDARLEETWLSEYSEAVNPPEPPQALHNLLSLPPRRARQSNPGRRTRSTSAQRNLLRRPAPKLYQTSSSQEQFSDDEEPQNPTVHFELSHTQLEMNADAFLATTDIHLQRRVLRLLHSRMIQLQAASKQSSSEATIHDRLILLKQALETWRGALQEQRFERRQEQHYQHLERKAERARDLFLITKAFTHWATQCSDELFRTRIAQHYVLRAKYFKRWRIIAMENQTKIRRILCRKYLAIWREKTTRCLLSQEQAQATYEESLMRRCKLSMFWEFCGRQVLNNHDHWIKRRAWSQLLNIVEQRRSAESQSEIICNSNFVRQKLQALRTCLRFRQHNSLTAAGRYDRTTSSKAIQSVKNHVKLEPLVRKFTLKTDLDLERKCFRLWRRDLEWARQAESIRTRMLLQNTFTAWNDKLRSRWIAGYAEDRIKQESLYRWALEAKLQRHQRRANGELLAELLRVWQARLHEDKDKIEYARAVFAEMQSRRRQRSGMVCLNLAQRRREDDQWTAVEFRNARTLSCVLVTMREKHDQLQKIENWARMANFYRLTTRSLRVWQERTTEHKANRRRDAYARVRARIKIRVVGMCFVRWHGKANEVQSMSDEAERRAHGRLEGATAGTLTRWRDRTARIIELEIQATAIDHERLLRSALGALGFVTAEKAILHNRLEQSKLDTDLALLASALRRLLWESFKAARNHESAEALRLRNRDTHAKQMLRHWAAQTAAKRLPPAADIGLQEPESPSLRPASRAASRASATTMPGTLPPPSSPPQRSRLLDSTPGYMRTPSRSRRAGRFRPLLTPAAGTPFGFDFGYLATTPAPLPTGMGDRDIGTTGVDAGMDGLAPQVTPFDRKLRAGGFGTAVAAPPSALRTSVLGRSVLGTTGGGVGTGKSVRFAGSGGRFGRGHLKTS